MKLASNSGVVSLLSLFIILPAPQDSSVLIPLIRCSLYGRGTKSYYLFISSTSGFYFFPLSSTDAHLVQAFITCL